MGAHSTFSASGAKRWLSCPGSINAERGMPNSSSEFAQLGTAAHALCDYCLRQRLQDVSLMLGGLIIMDKAEDCLVVPPAPDAAEEWEAKEFRESASFMKEYPIDEDMAQAVQVYVDTVFQELDRLPGAQLHTEKRVDLSKVYPSMFGTNDCSIVQPFGELVVIDYKHGQGVVVEVEDNDQEKFYALGVCLEEGFDFESVTLIIVQPRAQHEDGVVRRWSTTPQELKEFGKRLRAGAAATEDPNAPRVAGEWCGFCRAAATCPALHNRALEAAMIEFPDADTPVATEITMDTPDDVLARSIKMLPLIDAFVKSVEKEALRRAMSGTPVPGTKLVRKKSNRAWLVPPAELLERLAEFGVTPEQVYKEIKVKSPAQVEKLLPKKKLVPIVAELCHKPQGGITLVTDDDPREAVDPTTVAADDFDVVGDAE